MDEAIALSGELDRLQSLARQRESTDKFNIHDICKFLNINVKFSLIQIQFIELPGNRKALKGILIGIIITLLNQITGCYIFLTYAVMIFAKIGTSVHPYASTIILGIVQIAGTLLTTQLADRLGRKVLLIISLVGSVVGQLALATFLYLDKLGFDVALFDWVPVASTGFVIFIASVGIVPLMSICAVEMLSPKVSHNDSISMHDHCTITFTNHICMHFFNRCVLLASPFPQFRVIFSHSLSQSLSRFLAKS